MVCCVIEFYLEVSIHLMNFYMYNLGSLKKFEKPTFLYPYFLKHLTTIKKFSGLLLGMHKWIILHIAKVIFRTANIPGVLSPICSPQYLHYNSGYFISADTLKRKVEKILTSRIMRSYCRNWNIQWTIS